VIGATSQVAVKAVMPAIAASPRAHLVAAASQSTSGAAAHRVYTSYAALLDDPDVEAVYIPLPNSLHRAWVERAARAGKHVLCEKPLAPTAPDAAAMDAAASAAGVALIEAYMTPFHPRAAAIDALVRDGRLGQLRFARAAFTGVLDRADDHRWRPDMGGGALLDVGIYPLAFAQLILGNPDTAAATARLWPEGTDAATALLLGYTGGPLPRHAALTCASDAEGSLTGFIYGTEGHIALDPPYYRTKAFSVHRERGAKVERHEVPYDGNGLRFPAIEAGRCLREGLIESPLLPHADTLAVMRTMDAIRAEIGVRYPHETG